MREAASSVAHDLRHALAAEPDGPITDARRIEILLSACWDDFEGADSGGMHAGKLLGRTDGMTWEPPILRFQLDRHGGTVLGSSRATIQRWAIDVESGIATASESGFRQLRPMQARLSMEPIAEEVAKKIIDGVDDHRVKRSADGTVRVAIGEILPEGSAVAQTLAGRRRRLRETLGRLLEAAGYTLVGPNRWRPAGSDVTSKADRSA